MSLQRLSRSDTSLPGARSSLTSASRQPSRASTPDSKIRSQNRLANPVARAATIQLEKTIPHSLTRSALSSDLPLASWLPSIRMNALVEPF